jgi:hypothetical protein
MSMRWSCIARWSSGVLLAIATAEAGAADGNPRAALGVVPPGPVLRYGATGREHPVFPRDIAAMEISESGGITDIFIRLAPAATETMRRRTERGTGTPMIVRVCGTVMLRTTLHAPVDSGTVYLPGTTAVRAEAMRALWHGRARCDTLDAEVFEHGQW